MSGTVDLVVWGGEEDEKLMNQIIRSFEREYQGQADFNITFAVQGESNCKDKLIGGLEEGADVFTFADDQVAALAAAGALDPGGCWCIKSCRKRCPDPGAEFVRCRVGRLSGG